MFACITNEGEDLRHRVVLLFGLASVVFVDSIPTALHQAQRFINVVLVDNVVEA